MKTLSIILLAGVGALAARVLLSAGLVAGVASYTLGSGFLPADVQRGVMSSLGNLSRLTEVFASKPRYETISVLDVEEVQKRRAARSRQLTSGGSLILTIGD